MAPHLRMPPFVSLHWQYAFLSAMPSNATSKPQLPLRSILICQLYLLLMSTETADRSLKLKVSRSKFTPVSTAYNHTHAHTEKLRNENHIERIKYGWQLP